MSDFKIVQASLFRMGVGWFVAEKQVKGKNAFFPLPATGVNDFLKTALIQVDSDDDDYVMNLAFDTQSALTEFFETHEGITGLLDYLRAKDVEVVLSSNQIIKGKIIGYEEVADRKGEEHTKGKFVMSFYNEETRRIEFVSLTDVQSVYPVEGKQRELFLEHLLTSSSLNDAQKEVMMRIQFRGENEKNLRIHFLSEIPAWKITYRAYIRHETKEKNEISLETWGIVDNNTKIDWINCHLKLSTVMPVSFKYDLSTPLLISRPEIERETTMGIQPVIPESETDELEYDEYDEYMLKEAAAPKLKKSRRASFGAALSSASPPAPVERYRPSQAQAETEKSEFGESVIFELSQPVTIKKGQSAMVPLSTAMITGKRMLLFTEEAHGKHPFHVLDMKNTLDYALDKGPISVFEETEYLGEGMIPRLGLGEQYYLPFSLDQDVMVTHRHRSRTKSLTTGIEGRYSFELKKRYETHTWDIENKSRQDKTIVIELPKPKDYKLEDAMENDKELENVWRFTVKVSARKKKTLKKVISIELKHRMDLLGLSAKQIKELLKSTELSGKNKQIITRLVELKSKEDELKRRLTILENTYQKKREEREEVLKSLKVIKDTTDERDLRREYLSELKKLDKEKKDLSKEMQQVRADMEAVNSEIRDLVFKLDL